MQNVGLFFDTARERYRILLRRRDGAKRPWSDDPIFQEWRFCNVFREDDASTTWLRENVRGPMSAQHRSQTDITLAIAIYRWFNKPSVGEIVKDLLLTGWDNTIAAERLCNVRPIVTGAYMIRTPEGLNKLDGVLSYAEYAQEHVPDFNQWTTLRGAWTDLKTLDGLGPFLAAEVVQDLRWTWVLENAPDINEFTNAGPGCAKGLGWVLNGNRYTFDKNSRDDQVKMLAMMVEILELSRDSQNWPSEWPPWELHVVEFWACELWKYVKATNGDRLKRRFE